jgi:hypothetical protein
MKTCGNEATPFQKKVCKLSRYFIGSPEPVVKDKSLQCVGITNPGKPASRIRNGKDHRLAESAENED